MREYRFKIETYSPDTIPMARLAEYMTDVARLLGENDNSVHFIKLEAGSTKIVSGVDDEVAPNAEERVFQAKRGEGPRDAVQAFRNLARRIKEDQTSGALEAPTGIEIVKFPEPSEDTIKPLIQQGSLDGLVIMAGGQNDPVPIHLQTSDASRTVYNCWAKRDLAKELAHHLFQDEIRAYGSGRWLRDREGTWQLDRFTISNFEALSEEALSSVVTKLRSVTGSNWDSIPDPWRELERIRKGWDEDAE